MMIKCQSLLKRESDCLLSGEEDFVLCNLWQKEEGARGEKAQVPSDSMKSDWLWFADSCCLLADVGLHRFGFYASVFCKANTNKLDRLT